MKNKLLVGLALMTLSLGANADPDRHHYQDTAKVIDVEPIYRTIEVSHPQRNCWDEDVSIYEPAPKSYTGTILGGVIGGVLVNTLHQGHGRGKDAATLAGALVGSAVGHDVSQKNRDGHYVTRTERRCEVEDRVSYEEELVGYRVKYRYDGRVYTTRTREHPGKYINVHVGVSPVNEF